MTTAARATRTPTAATPVAPAPARAPGPAKAPVKPWTMSGAPLVGASALQRSAQPGEVDLSAGTLDPSKVAVDSKDRASARLGKLAAGEISLTRTASGALRTTGRGSAIPLTLPGLGPALAGRTVLVVIVADNVISGYAALGSPGAFVARSDDALLGLALKDPAALGLAGMSRISPTSTTNRLEQGTLALGADIAFTLGGWLTGRGALALAGEHLNAEGEAAITLPGGSGTLKVAAAAGKELAGDASLRLARGKLTGAADARLRGPTLDVVGTATYAGDRLRGSLTVAAIDADAARKIHRQNPIPDLSIEAASPRPGPRAFCGAGELDVTMTEWLIGRAKVVVNSEGEATVQGEITPPGEIVLFPQRDWVKRLGTFEARAPYGLPVIGNVFLFANISLEALATLGPGTLTDIKLSGQYSTDRSVGRELDLRATLRIPAFAGLRVRAEGGAGLQVLAHDVKTGVSVWGLAGVRGYAQATPAITYRSKDGGPGEFVLAGHLELAAQPFLGLGGELFLAVESPALSPLPSERRTWPMSGLEYPLPGEFGIAADVAHVLGSKTCPEVQLREVAFDASNFMSDLLRDSPASDKGKSQAKKPATWTEAASPGTPATHAPATHKTAPSARAPSTTRAPGKSRTARPRPTTGEAPGARKADARHPDIPGASQQLATQAARKGWQVVQARTEHEVLDHAALEHALRGVSGAEISLDVVVSDRSWWIRARVVQGASTGTATVGRGWVALDSGRRWFAATDQSQRHEAIVRDADRLLDEEAREVARDHGKLRDIHQALRPRIRIIEVKLSEHLLKGIRFTIDEDEFTEGTDEHGDVALLYSWEIRPNTSKKKLAASGFKKRGDHVFAHGLTKLPGKLRPSVAAAELITSRPGVLAALSSVESDVSHPAFELTIHKPEAAGKEGDAQSQEFGQAFGVFCGGFPFFLEELSYVDLALATDANPTEEVTAAHTALATLRPQWVAMLDAAHDRECTPHLDSKDKALEKAGLAILAALRISFPQSLAALLSAASTKKKEEPRPAEEAVASKSSARAPGPVPTPVDKGDRTPEQKQADLNTAIAEVEVLQDAPKPTKAGIQEALPAIQEQHGLTRLELIVEAQTSSGETIHVEGEINPKKKSKRSHTEKDHEGSRGTLQIQGGDIKRTNSGARKDESAKRHGGEGYMLSYSWDRMGTMPTPFPVGEGLSQLQLLWNALFEDQQVRRTVAYNSAREWIRSSLDNSPPGRRAERFSYNAKDPKYPNARVDVVIAAGLAFDR